MKKNKDLWHLHHIYQAVANFEFARVKWDIQHIEPFWINQLLNVDSCVDKRGNWGHTLNYKTFFFCVFLCVFCSCYIKWSVLLSSCDKNTTNNVLTDWAFKKTSAVLFLNDWGKRTNSPNRAAITDFQWSVTSGCGHLVQSQTVSWVTLMLEHSVACKQQFTAAL